MLTRLTRGLVAVGLTLTIAACATAPAAGYRPASDEADRRQDAARKRQEVLSHLTYASPSRSLSSSPLRGGAGGGGRETG